jgi:hypothetical protein
MKNKFIINNKSVPFVDISKSVIDSTIDNILQDDMSIQDFFISNNQIIDILQSSIKSDVIINPLKNYSYNGNYFTNIQDDVFDHKISYIIDNVIIPDNLGSNDNNLCKLSIDFLSNCDQPSDKSLLYKIFREGEPATGSTSAFKLMNYSSYWRDTG